MLHLGIVRPDERDLITNPLGLAAVRLTNEAFVARSRQKTLLTEPRGKHFREASAERKTAGPALRIPCQWARPVLN